MNLNYLIYKIFETKWKKHIFDLSVYHLHRIEMINNFEHGDDDYNIREYHFKESLKLMELIM